MDDATRELHRRARAGDVAARNEIAEKNLGLAYQYAIEASRRIDGVPLEDLEGYAMHGLLLAAGKHDPERGTKFSTTAYQWMRSTVGAGTARYLAWLGEPRNLRVSRRSYLSRLTPAMRGALESHGGRREGGGRALDGLACPRTSPPEARGADADSLPWHVLSGRERRAVRICYGLADRHGGGKWSHVAKALRCRREAAPQRVGMAIRKLARAAREGGAA